MDKSKKKNNVVDKVMSFFQQHSQFGALLIFVVVAIVFTALSPVKNGQNVFISASNLASVLEQTSAISILAFGMTVVLLAGGIDISVGSTMALVGVVTARLIQLHSMPLGYAILIGLLIGAVVGAINGLLIITFKMQPFLATMGMQTVVRGFCYFISKGESTYLTDRTISEILVRYKIFDVIPICAIWTLVFLVLSYLYVNHTKFGRWTQAIGGNESAAVTSGINVGATKVVAYIICSFTAAFAGLISMARLGTGVASAGVGYEMNAIAAAIIGGTSFSGDGGNMIGTLLGALVIGVLVNGLTILSVNSYIQDIVQGCIILVAVIGSNVLMMRRK